MKLEILNLDGEPNYSDRKKSDFYKYWMNFRNFLVLDDEENITQEVYNLTVFSVKKYNELLSEMSLPLSTCKLLMRQRDSIEEGMIVLKRQETANVA